MKKLLAIYLLLHGSAQALEVATPAITPIHPTTNPAVLSMNRAGIFTGVNLLAQSKKEKAGALTRKERESMSAEIVAKLVASRFGAEIDFTPSYTETTYEEIQDTTRESERKNSQYGVRASYKIFSPLGFGLGYRSETTGDDEESGIDVGGTYRISNSLNIGLMTSYISNTPNATATGNWFDSKLGVGIATKEGSTMLRGELSYLRSPEAVAYSDDEAESSNIHRGSNGINFTGELSAPLNVGGMGYFSNIGYEFSLTYTRQSGYDGGDSKDITELENRVSIDDANKKLFLSLLYNYKSEEQGMLKNTFSTFSFGLGHHF